ncbi:MAG: RNA degradosome polyphosphate kinase, partial [Gaiellaceae bacterium]
MSDSVLTKAQVGGDDEAPDLRSPALYINRELSWLDFNARVLELAEDDDQPLMERLKFLAIYTTNLDDFFMVRVAGVHEQIEARVDRRYPDGLTPSELMEEIARKTRTLDRRHARQFGNVVMPALAAEGIRIVSCSESGADAEQLKRHFLEHIFPVLTPLAIGPGRPFPYISNLSLSLLVHLHDPALETELYARVKVPKEVLPRFVEIAKGTFVPLEDIIAHHLDTLFPGMEVVSHSLFRVTRDADFDISDEADDLLAAVEDELRRRRFGEVVRLEVSSDIEPAMRAHLVEWLDLDENQVYDEKGMLDLSDLWQIVGLEGHSELRQRP